MNPATYDNQAAEAQEVSGWDRFLWWLSAADANIMKDCGPDRFRYSVIGYTVLATWIFATLSWGYFFSTLFEDAVIVVPAAAFFGFVILTIDRGLIAGLNNGGSGRLFYLIIRLVLALTIGFFLSQPIVLMLFQKDVDSHLPIIKEKKTQAFTQQVQQQNAVNLNQAKAEVDRIRNTQKAKEQEIVDLKNGYIKETDGTGGSGKVGESSIARVKKTAYLKAEDDLLTWKRENQPLLDSALAKQNRVETDINGQIARFETGLSDGFLTRVETLDDLMLTHPPVKYRYRLVIVLIMLIELMPLLTKLMMRSGLYEERLRLAVEKQRGLWGNERTALKEMDGEFYRQALDADKKLQQKMLREMENFNNSRAEAMLEDWKKEPEEARSFWEKLKGKVFFFHR